MEEKSKETTIDLMKLFRVVWDRILWVILAVVVLAAAAYLITRLTWHPTYTSEVQLYTVMSSADDNTEVTTSQISIRRNVAALYVKAIKKSDSLREMSDDLKLSGFNVGTSQLSQMLSVKIDEDAAEIIHVKAKTSDPELSLKICEIVGNKAASLVEDAYIGCTVAIFNHPSLPSSPDRSNSGRNGVIGGLIGFVLSVGVIVAIYLLDKSIKSGDELEKLTGIRYLGDIPDVNDSLKGGKYEYGSKSKTQTA